MVIDNQEKFIDYNVEYNENDKRKENDKEISNNKNLHFSILENKLNYLEKKIDLILDILIKQKIEIYKNNFNNNIFQKENEFNNNKDSENNNNENYISGILTRSKLKNNPYQIYQNESNYNQNENENIINNSENKLNDIKRKRYNYSHKRKNKNKKNFKKKKAVTINLDEEEEEDNEITQIEEKSTENKIKIENIEKNEDLTLLNKKTNPPKDNIEDNYNNEKDNKFFDINNLYKKNFITNENIITSINLNKQKHYYVFLKEEFNINKNQKGIFKIIFRLLTDVDWLGVGICDKKLVEENNYSNSLY